MKTARTLTRGKIRSYKGRRKSATSKIRPERKIDSRGTPNGVACANFADDLADSFELCGKKTLERHFAEYYGDDYLGVALENDDGKAQRAGVDGCVFLRDGAKTFDLKIRRTSYGDDVALEYVSNDRTETPGWIEKELACDIVAYYVEPLDELIVLPRRELQAAWRRNADEWLDLAQDRRRGFMIAKAANDGYNSLNLVVPTDVLLRSMFQMRG